jgi:hypothetical protein
LPAIIQTSLRNLNRIFPSNRTTLFTQKQPDNQRKRKHQIKELQCKQKICMVMKCFLNTNHLILEAIKKVIALQLSSNFTHCNYKQQKQQENGFTSEVHHAYLR